MIKLKDKNIILFGNAKSIFNKERKVDNKYDIICRINKGLPKGKEKYIGNRTDVLFLSLNLSENEVKKFNSQYVVVCSPKIKMRQYFDTKYCPLCWERLYNILKARPSTGIMAFDYILLQGFKTLTLIGFDFWESPNWYTNNIHIAEHNPKAEKRYIKEKIKEYKGKIKIE